MWILVPYLTIIGILIIMAIRMYNGYSKRYRLNKNLKKYTTTIHDMQIQLTQVNQSLHELSVDEKLDENANAKIRMAIWRINTIQDTLNKLVGLEKDQIGDEKLHPTNRKQAEVEAGTTEIVPASETDNTAYDTGNAPSANDQLFLEKVFIVIRDHYVDPHFNVDTLSYKMGMSRSSFFNKTKAIMGQAPADVIRQYRMERAKELLKTKKYTISEIAYKSGFSDAKYFRDVFRKKYNQSPSQYAKTR